MAKIKIKGLKDEDFVNYKKPSMFIAFPTCTWKCEKDCGLRVCQNNTLVKTKNIEIDISKVIDRYTKNPITKAIVCGGLEPFDSWKDLQELIRELRKYTQDDIVIFTGFYKKEIKSKIKWLSFFPNIVVKFGRYVPDQEKHYDEVLGVYLASSNQYAERIS